MGRLAIVLIAGLLLACGGGDDGDAEQACRDVADAFGDLCDRCNVDTYQACYNAILQGVNGDCANVVNIRDIEELYDQCIPWIENESCAQVNAPGWELDTSCVGQLQI